MKYSYRNVMIIASPEMACMAEGVYRRLKNLGVPVDFQVVEYEVFTCGEIKPKIHKSVRKSHVFFFHSMFHPNPNTALVKLMLVNDVLKRAYVNGITIVAPYLSYLRQDRKDERKARVPISARLIADLIELTGKVDGLITMDMHANQEEGFFSIPVDHLLGCHVQASYWKRVYSSDMSNVVVCAPDFGSVVRARFFMRLLGENIGFVIVEKKRGKGSVEILSIIGDDVNGKDVIIFDDIVDSAGTLELANNALRERGAKSVSASITHAVLSTKNGVTAESHFVDSQMSLVTTDSIPRSEDYLKANPWMKVIPLEETLAETIYESLIVGGSVSRLHD